MLVKFVLDDSAIKPIYNDTNIESIIKVSKQLNKLRDTTQI